MFLERLRLVSLFVLLCTVITILILTTIFWGINPGATFRLGFQAIWIENVSNTSKSAMNQDNQSPSLLASQREDESHVVKQKEIEETSLQRIYLDLLPKVHDSIINEVRRNLQTELSDSQSHNITGLVGELGGQPMRSVIITSWRSGSSFLGSILEAAAGTFYYNEPFNYLYTEQFRNAAASANHLQEFSDFLNCNFANLANYVQFAGGANFVFDSNTRFRQYCQGTSRAKLCADASFLTRLCKLFPFQAAKVCRMRLRLVQRFLDDTSYKLKVIYLVRDPRGTMSSRRNGVCTGVEGCDSPDLLCSDLEDDYEVAASFLKLYPDKFMAIRFEDLVLNIHQAVKKIYGFLGLSYDKRVQNYISEHTSQHVDGALELHRKSKEVPFRWRDFFANRSTELNDIQHRCSKAIVQWGYRLSINSSDLKTLSPLDDVPWKQMLV